MKSLLVISSYPNQNSVHTGGGLASYTKLTVLAIKKADPNRKITVLANIIDQPETYHENGVTVIRCWRRNSPTLYLSLLNQTLKQKSTDILFGFEFAAYGDIFITSFMPIFLALLKLAGKNIVSVVHQVVPNLSQIATHAGIEKQAHIKLLNQGVKIFFNTLSFASSKVVTLEENLSDRFNSITNSNKAVSIPHGLFTKKSEKRSSALQKLNLDPKHLYVLTFGYLSHYKGTDLAVKAFQKPIKVNGKTVKLVLAGGESPTQGQKPHYQHFYKKLYDSINDNENIIHNGFVPHERIKHFFSGCDLVVFPYRSFMSASGPISLSISYSKPFIASNKLKGYTPHTFLLNSKSLRKSIVKTLSNKRILKKLEQNSYSLAKARDFNNQGVKYLNLFSKPTEVSHPVLSWK